MPATSRSTGWNHRRLLVKRFLVLATILGLLQPLQASGAGAAETVANSRTQRAVPSAPMNHNYNATMTVQFNIWGGQGSAFTGYNATVAPAIENSIMSRPNYPFVVSLNEICESQYNHIMWVLNANGYGYNAATNPSGYSYSQMMSLGMFFGTRIGNYDLHPACGGWYGNALLMRGTFVAGGNGWFTQQEPSDSGERRSWLCKQTNLAVAVGCGAHLENGANSYTMSQSIEYRNIANYVGASGVWALGDFNFPAGNAQRTDWMNNGFVEADGCCASRSTTDGGSHYDYAFRKNMGSYPHPAYIYNSSYSDHHWYQPYW